MELLNTILVSLGISSPLLIGLATAIFFAMRGFMESRFEAYKEVSIAKIKNELDVKILESQHRLTIEYDRIRNIQDNQKEKLTKILSELNSIVSRIFDGFNPTENEFSLVDSNFLLKAKRSIYADGLYIDSVALELISSFFDRAEANSSAQYDFVDHHDFIPFAEFDYRLLEVIQNEVFFCFRRQIGIDEAPLQSSSADAVLSLAVLSSIHRRIESQQVLDVMSVRQDIMHTIATVSTDAPLRKVIYDEVERLRDRGDLKWESPRDINRLLNFFSETRGQTGRSLP